MKVIAFVAVACMSMWISDSVNAQDSEDKMNGVEELQQEVQGEPWRNWQTAGTASWRCSNDGEVIQSF